jgi:hypothetical protein
MHTHPATCQIGRTAQSSNHVVELYAQHHLQVYNPIKFFKVPPPTTRGEHQLRGSLSPYLEVLWQSDPHCSAWIHFFLSWSWGAGVCTKVQDFYIIQSAPMHHLLMLFTTKEVIHPFSIINPLAFSLHFQGLIFPLCTCIISSPSHNFALFKFASQSFPRQNCNCCMDLYMHWMFMLHHVIMEFIIFSFV